MNHLEYSSTPPLPFLIAGSLSFRSRFRPAADARAASFPPHYTGNICISVYRLNIHEGVPVSGRFARQIQGESYELPFALLLFSHSTPSSLASFFLFPPSILVSPASALYVQPALPSSASVGDWLREQLRGMEEKHECHPAFCASPLLSLPLSLVSRSRQVLLYQFLARRGTRGRVHL